MMMQMPCVNKDKLTFTPDFFKHKLEEKGNMPGTTIQIPQPIRFETRNIQTYTTHKCLDNDDNT